jgi:acyl-coenzyme A synthetase/AMP-(fatty) acid ligase
MSLHSLSAAAPGIHHSCPEAAAEIDFTIPERYNASALLFDNLDRGRGSHLAITGPSGSRTYAELCGDAARYGLTLLDLGLTRGDRVADLSSLRMCLSAAEVLSNEVAELWRQVTGQQIIEGLGSTEVLHIYLSNTPSNRKPAAAGRPVPGYQIKLVDQNDLDGDEGILWVRGDSNAPCYWNRPDKTSETMRADGWIYTGDRMRRDADGSYFFLGRADDLVKISGQWVYPLEVELCLSNHPLVRECAVMAMELPDRRITLKAFVVLNNGASEQAAVTKTLQDYVKQTLLPHKYPRIVEFRDELPKTGTGKIDRQMLFGGRVKTTA